MSALAPLQLNSTHHHSRACKRVKETTTTTTTSQPLAHNKLEHILLKTFWTKNSMRVCFFSSSFYCTRWIESDSQARKQWWVCAIRNMNTMAENCERAQLRNASTFQIENINRRAIRETELKGKCKIEIALKLNRNLISIIFFFRKMLLLLLLSKRDKSFFFHPLFCANEWNEGVSVCI